ncbi:DegV family protein [Butyrivibrio sp. AE2032]|uniref:DegV family protein n=1 Tax=Butyrivibrio sp. AE2032 TaxID=1458463 RepID=UPI00068D4694|nr:DegV family protein [Butyrivibrio sp. AE2032]
MRDMLRYLFKPSSNDPEAIKSAYYESVGPTRVTMILAFLAAVIFLTLTFVYPAYFGGTTVLYHQICYVWLLAVVLIWMFGINHAMKDFETRYRTVYVLNHFMGISLYLWVVSLVIVNSLARGTLDTTLFMTVALVVPLCVYFNPIAYVIIALLSNAAMASFMFYMVSNGAIEPNELANFTIFSVFQVVMGIIMSYTRFRLNEQLVTAERQRKEIVMLNKSQNSFFSNMSHEIRTPINTIIGLNEMILREDVSEEVVEDAVNIKAAGKLLLSLINDILDMSKFQSGSMQLLIEPYHTGDMLSDIVGMLWIRAKDKKLDFTVDVSPDIPAELVGDEVRIKQILINVINNAIKYTKEGSVSLTVQCEMKEDKTCNMIYMVTDTGIGIKSEDIPYLFSAFKRVDETATKHIEGTGLGLSIVKQLVDLMGGKITVNSVYKKGSTFIIEIPQRVEREGSVGNYDFAKAGSTTGRKKEYLPKFEAPQARILVVDDNEANLMVVSKLLRDTKVRIDTASSGVEALRKTLNIKYDVIFMDHLMPEMDGIECRRQIKDQTGGRCRESAIVILTANADEENRALYARENFDGYLAKPVSGEALENELYNHLPKEIVKITGNRSEIAEESISWMKGAKKRKSIVITTESVADLSPEIIEKYGIAVLPHKVHTEEGIFKDGKEIETLGVLKYMEDPNHIVLPQGPTVREVEEFFAKQLSYSNNIVHISISSKIEHSGYKPALDASKSFDNVFVIDSAHLSSGQGLLAIEACRMAEAGLTPEEIIKDLEVVKKKIHTSFIVDNLDFLARAGQVGNGTANIVKSLMVRPILVLRKGKMGVGMSYFGSREKAWKAYISSVLNRGASIDTRVLFVTYVGINKHDLDWIREQIEKRMHFDEIYFKQASPAIAVNCGAGTFGLLYMEK